MPTTEPTWVIRVCSIARAIPKSVSFTVRLVAAERAADDHQVSRLDVAVDDPAAVGIVEPGAGLDPDLGREPRLERALALQDLGSGAPLDELHDDVVAPLVDPGVVDLDDVGVDQFRDGERLAPEAGDEPLVVGEVLGEDLDRDGALEDPVGCPMHGRHPARAEAPVDLIAPG